jgi:hypothetical protein
LPLSHWQTIGFGMPVRRENSVCVKPSRSMYSARSDAMPLQLSHGNSYGKTNYQNHRRDVCFSRAEMAEPATGEDLRKRLARWVIAYEKKMGHKSRKKMASALGIPAPQLSNILNFERLLEEKGKIPTIGLDTFVRLHAALSESMDRMVRYDPDDVAGGDRRPATPQQASAESAAPRRRRGGTPGGRM